MQVMTIILDFMLFAVTALIFSITILCILLYRRVADNYLKGFLSILLPLFLNIGLAVVNTYISRLGLNTDPRYATFALLATFVSIFCSAAVLIFLSRYLSNILPIPEVQRRLAYRIINVIGAAYLLACLFAIFQISESDWIASLNLVLNELFLSGSLLLTAHGITALFYLGRAENREQENLMRSLIITFLPLVPFAILDFLFLKGMAFKLTYISFTIFCVSIYLFISRHYIRKYEPAIADLTTVPPPDLTRKGFSKREEEIITLLIAGKTNQEIGEELFISINTVKTHIKNIYGKLKVSNRIQLINKIREL